MARGNLRRTRRGTSSGRQAEASLQTVIGRAGTELYSCSPKKFRALGDCLLRLLGDDCARDPRGIRLLVDLEELGAGSAKDFRRGCSHARKYLRHAGDISEETVEAVGRTLFPARYGAPGAVVAHPPAGTRHVVRDENGCLLGAFDREYIHDAWPNARDRHGVFTVPGTIEFAEALDSLSRMRPRPTVGGTSRVGKEVEAARFGYFVLGLDEPAGSYWESQSDVAWDVRLRGGRPLCTLPYSMLDGAFPGIWFCARPHVAQIATRAGTRALGRMVERGKAMAALLYDEVPHAGGRCPRSPGFPEGKWWVDDPAKVEADADGLTCAFDEEGVLLAVLDPDELIDEFGCVMAVSDGYVPLVMPPRARSGSLGVARRHLRAGTASEAHRDMLVGLLDRVGGVVSVRDSRGHLVGYFGEGDVWRRWRVASHASESVVPDKIPDATRASLLRESLASHAGRLSAEQADSMRAELRALRDKEWKGRYPGSAKGWRETVSVAGAHLSDAGWDPATVTEVCDVLALRLRRNHPHAIAARVRRGLEHRADADGLSATELVGLAWRGDEASVRLVAEAMAADIAGNGDGEYPPLADEPKEAAVWAEPVRAYVLAWAERTLGSEGELRGRPEVLYVADSVRGGRADVLVFDEGLYQEVTSADMEGAVACDPDSWPYPVSIIRLEGFGGVYGVATCKANDVNGYVRKNGLPPLGGEGGLRTFLMGDGVGAMDTAEDALGHAERLLAYIDCDNALTRTIYLDGGGRWREGGAAVATPHEAEYRVGADYTTGDRVVVVRDRGGADGKPAGSARRAHFRRGYYRRCRVGSRDNWHYEKRWVRPTFVHGSDPSVTTQHLVTRIVL